MATLDQWKTNVGQLIMIRLPNHDLDSARALATSWLSDNGGWIPDDVGDPTGEGEVTATDIEVADEVRALELARTKTVTVQFPVILKTTITGSFGSDSTGGDIVELFQEKLETRLSELIGVDQENTIKILSYDWLAGKTTIRTTGLFDVDDRTGVEQEISEGGEGGGSNLIDPAAIATKHIRNFLGLDSTWVSTFVYSKDNNAETPVSVEIKKYTDTSYSVLDDSATSYYVVTLDRDTGRPQTITRRSST
jgi:hypothetical protein